MVIPVNQSVEITLTATFTAIITGIGPFKYQWQRGNQILTNETKTHIQFIMHQKKIKIITDAVSSISMEIQLSLTESGFE